MADGIIELSKSSEEGLEIISDRNMHRIMRFLYENYGSNDIKKTMLNRFCTPQALNECLNRLEDAGFIYIEPRKEPQNVFYIRMTPLGMLFEKADVLETFLADCGELKGDELEQLMAEWDAKVRIMVERDPRSEEFFRRNRLDSFL